MQFFTQIGIDWRLLIAQIINFILLLVLLTKFLYKPIVKQIQDDEQKRSEVDAAKKAIQDEKDLARKETMQELTKAREDSQSIIAQAAVLAEDIKKQANTKQLLSHDKYVASLKEESVVLSDLIRERITEEERTRILQKTINALDKMLDDVRKEDLERMFFDLLLHSVQHSRFSRKQVSLPVRLEYAVSLSDSNLSQLEQVLCEKMQVTHVRIEKHKNTKLICGVSLQVAGMYFSHNVYSTIHSLNMQK